MRVHVPAPTRRAHFILYNYTARLCANKLIVWWWCARDMAWLKTRETKLRRSSMLWSASHCVRVECMRCKAFKLNKWIVSREKGTCGHVISHASVDLTKTAITWRTCPAWIAITPKSTQKMTNNGTARVHGTRSLLPMSENMILIRRCTASDNRRCGAVVQVASVTQSPYQQCAIWISQFISYFLLRNFSIDRCVTSSVIASVSVSVKGVCVLVGTVRPHEHVLVCIASSRAIACVLFICLSCWWVQENERNRNRHEAAQIVCIKWLHTICTSTRTTAGASKKERRRGRSSSKGGRTVE